MKITVEGKTLAEVKNVAASILDNALPEFEDFKVSFHERPVSVDADEYIFVAIIGRE